MERPIDKSFVSCEIPTGEGILAHYLIENGRHSVRAFLRPHNMMSGMIGDKIMFEELVDAVPVFEVVVSDPRAARVWAEMFQRIAAALMPDGEE